MIVTMTKVHRNLLSYCIAGNCHESLHELTVKMELKLNAYPIYCLLVANSYHSLYSVLEGHIMSIYNMKVLCIIVFSICCCLTPEGSPGQQHHSEL